VCTLLKLVHVPLGVLVVPRSLSSSLEVVALTNLLPHKLWAVCMVSFIVSSSGVLRKVRAVDGAIWQAPLPYMRIAVVALDVLEVVR
jgi:hypothetical protein